VNVQVILIQPAKLDDQEDLEDVIDIGVTLERRVMEIDSDCSIELTIKPDPSGPMLNGRDPPACALTATLKNDSDVTCAPRFIQAHAYVWPSSTGTPIVIRILEPSITCDGDSGLAIDVFCETLIGLFGLERPSLSD
jgi:hypothetical protein